MNMIGERIALLRKKQSMTQEELASRIGVSAQSVSKWENGVNLPDVMLLPIIADVFSVTIDELYGNRRELGASCDLPEEVYDSLLTVLRAATSGDSDLNQIKNYLAEHRECKTVVYSGKGGAVYANSELGLIWRKSELSPSEILNDEKALGFLSALSEPAFVKILSYMLENASLSFTVQSVSLKCGISVQDTEKAVEKLYEYDFASCRKVDVCGDPIKVYGLCSGHRMLLVYAIMRFASGLASYREHYFGFKGDPDYWYC